MGNARRRREPLGRGSKGGRGDVARPASSNSRRGTWAALVVILGVTLVAFLPAFQADLLGWDDNRYIANNPLVREPSGLAEIWNPCSPALTKHFLQYYPLVFSSYWLEYRFVQTDPFLYHVTNVVLHLCNVALALLLAERLGASRWAAVGTAALFALHPVQVASVVWVAERKNVLSGLFYLLAFLLYLRWRERRDRASYALSLAAFAGALLSKTLAATLPLAIILYELVAADAGRRQRLSAQTIAARIAPMLVLALAAAPITMRVEGAMHQAWFDIPPPTERPILAATAAWFYAGKFLLPVGLAPIYPKWEVSWESPAGWLALVAWPLTLGVLLRLRRRVPPLSLWGTGQFFISLAPTVGLTAFAYLHIAYVADHYLYLSCFGGALAIAVAVDRILGAGGWNTRRIVAGAVGCLLILVLAWQTQREARFWKDDLTFFRRAVERNPQSHVANMQLGMHLMNVGRPPDALPRFVDALRASEPNGVEYNRALTQYARALSAIEGPAAVVEACSEELERYPGAFKVRIHRAKAYEDLGRLAEALADYDAVLRAADRGSLAWLAAQRERDRLRRRLAP
jgi:tetratricopeptide (TPR) repeat protein